MYNHLLKNTMVNLFQSACLLATACLYSVSSIANAAFTSPSQTLTTAHNETLVYHELKAANQLDKPKPAIILLGGGPGFSSWNLEPIQTLLHSFGHSTYLMDMRGIGENADLATHRLQKTITQLWVEDIDSLIQQLPQTSSQKPILIGHSWGALMAMLYTQQYPDHVSQLLLLNPVDPEKHAMRDLTENIHQKNLQAQQITWDDEKAWNNEVSELASELQAREITERQITQVLPTYFYDYQQGQSYAKMFNHTDFDIELNVQAWKAYDANPITYEQIRNWHLPVDFLDCRQDSLMPENLQALENNQVLRKIIVLDKCSHFPWVEQPKAFEQAIKYIVDSE